MAKINELRLKMAEQRIAEKNETYKRKNELSDMKKIEVIEWQR